MPLTPIIYLLIWFIVALVILWIVVWAIETFGEVTIPRQIKGAIAIVLLLVFLLYALGHVGVLGRW